MSVTGHEFALPARLSQDDLQALRTQLEAHSALPFTVSAKAWRNFDSLTLQLLLAAAHDWARRGQRFVVTGLSSELAATFRQIGVGRDMLIWEEAE